MKWKPFGLGVTILFAIVFGIATQIKHRLALDVERGKTQAAIERTHVAMQYADAAVTVAESYKARADAADRRADSAAKVAIKYKAERIKLQPAVERAIAAAPDTCKPVIDTLSAALAAADSTAEHYQTAFEDQKRATAYLQAAYDTTRSALDSVSADARRLASQSQKLVNASKRSFFSRFIPEIGFGGAVGLDPTGKPNVVLGPTLSWRF